MKNAAADSMGVFFMLGRSFSVKFSKLKKASLFIVLHVRIPLESLHIFGLWHGTYKSESRLNRKVKKYKRKFQSLLLMTELN